MLIWWSVFGVVLLAFAGFCYWIYAVESIKFRMGLTGLSVVFAILAYWQWGSWSQVNAFHEQQALIQFVKNPHQLIETLKQKLATHPRDPRGWYWLGRLYTTQSAFTKALTAYAMAYRLAPTDPKIKLAYAQLLNGLASNAFETHDYAKAIHYWQKLLAILPPQNEAREDILKAISQAKSMRSASG